jgi:hypothetical protein
MLRVWMAFKSCTDRIETLSIFALATRREIGQIGKRMRRERATAEIPLYKYKLGLLHAEGNFVIRMVDKQSGQVTFKHITPDLTNISKKSEPSTQRDREPVHPLSSPPSAISA